jgi:histone H3/H4
LTPSLHYPCYIKNQNIGDDKMAEILVVGSKVKEFAKKSEVNVAGDFIEGLSKEVEILIEKAVARARSNGRKTVKALDL